MTHTYGNIFSVGGKRVKARNNKIRKMFELDDGTIFQTENNNAQSVRPAACDCKIIYDGKTITYLQVIRKCKGHQSFNGQNLLTQAIKTTADFQNKHPDFKNHDSMTPAAKKEMFDKITKAQADNRDRFRKLEKNN